MITLKESMDAESEVLSSFKNPRQKDAAQSYMTGTKHAIARMFNSYPFYGGKGSGQLTKKQARDAFQASQYGNKMGEATRDIIGTGAYGMTLPPLLNDWVEGQWGRAWQKIETEYQFKDVQPKEEPPAPDKKPTGPRMTPQERTKAQVYATGNKWAIDNFNATHDRGW